MKMTAKETLETMREAIETLCRRFGVTRLMLFGSSVREDWDPATSDFDFLAEFDVRIRRNFGGPGSRYDSIAR